MPRHLAARPPRSPKSNVSTQSLSGYHPSSEFRRWTATHGEPKPVSSDLFDVLKLWDFWRGRTSGALNPAAESIGRVWKAAEVSGQAPAAGILRAVSAEANRPHWQLDAGRNTATHLTAAPLILNSFTKSYIIERAADAAMKAPGIEAVVVNIGGDLVVRGHGAEKVSVMDSRSGAENGKPVAVLEVADRAVATSGNYRRGFDIAGHHYSHIMDPRTGYTADDVLNATVVAPKAVDAGALLSYLAYVVWVP